MFSSTKNFAHTYSKSEEVAPPPSRQREPDFKIIVLDRGLVLCLFFTFCVCEFSDGFKGIFHFLCKQFHSDFTLTKQKETKHVLAKNLFEHLERIKASLIGK